MEPDDEQTNLRMPRDLKEWLKDRALKNRRSMTSEVVLLLESSRKQEEAQGATQ